MSKLSSLSVDDDDASVGGDEKWRQGHTIKELINHYRAVLYAIYPDGYEMHRDLDPQRRNPSRFANTIRPLFQQLSDQNLDAKYHRVMEWKPDQSVARFTMLAELMYDALIKCHDDEIRFARLITFSAKFFPLTLMADKTAPNAENSTGDDSPNELAIDFKSILLNHSYQVLKECLDGLSLEDFETIMQTNKSQFPVFFLATNRLNDLMIEGTIKLMMAYIKQGLVDRSMFFALARPIIDDHLQHREKEIEHYPNHLVFLVRQFGGQEALLKFKQNGNDLEKALLEHFIKITKKICNSTISLLLNKLFIADEFQSDNSTMQRNYFRSFSEISHLKHMLDKPKRKNKKKKKRNKKGQGSAAADPAAVAAAATGDEEDEDPEPDDSVSSEETSAVAFE